MALVEKNLQTEKKDGASNEAGQQTEFLKNIDADSDAGNSGGDSSSTLVKPAVVLETSPVTKCSAVVPSGFRLLSSMVNSSTFDTVSLKRPDIVQSPWEPCKRTREMYNPMRAVASQRIPMDPSVFTFRTSHGRKVGTYDFSWSYSALFRVANRP